MKALGGESPWPVIYRKSKYVIKYFLLALKSLHLKQCPLALNLMITVQPIIFITLG